MEMLGFFKGHCVNLEPVIVDKIQPGCRLSGDILSPFFGLSE